MPVQPTSRQRRTPPSRWRPRSAEWTDPDPAVLGALVARSRVLGWRAALDAFERDAPLFARRIRNLPLGNWHLLLLRPRSDRAVDVGCGFGSLALGLAEYYRAVLGIDALPLRVDFATLRAREDASTRCAFAQGSAFALPVRDAGVDLVTMNGVLEWAGLYADGAPDALQRRMLVEARRVLRPGGTCAIAIENRFAMETVVGMPDTHTGLRWVPMLTRGMADVASRLRRAEPYRTYLYGQHGYRALLHTAGFRAVRIYDLVSSYNDYDFVVDPDDTATYQLLHGIGAIRTFYRRAGTARRLVGRTYPRLLGHLGYAYLVFGGERVSTVLDADHPIWAAAAARNISPGQSRFACQGDDVATMLLIAHDHGRPTGAIEVSAHGGPVSDTGALSRLRGTFGLRPLADGSWRDGDVAFRCYAPARRGDRVVTAPDTDGYARPGSARRA